MNPITPECLQNFDNAIEDITESLQAAIDQNKHLLKIQRDLYTLIHQIQIKIKQEIEHIEGIIRENIQLLLEDEEKLKQHHSQIKQQKVIQFKKIDYQDMQNAYQNQKAQLKILFQNLKQQTQFDYESILLVKQQEKFNQSQYKEHQEQEITEENFKNFRRIGTRPNQKQNERVIEKQNENEIEQQSQNSIEERTLAQNQDQFEKIFAPSLKQTNYAMEENTIQQPQEIIQNIQQERMVDQNFNEYKNNIIFSQKEPKKCKLFEFNHDFTILFVTKKNLIELFSFNEGIIGDKIQILQGHKKTIKCLVSYKKFNQMISGSSDSKIIIWKQNKDAIFWHFLKVLKIKNNPVCCINLNNDDNLMISGGNTTLNIWQFDKNEWIRKQQLCCSNVSSFCSNKSFTILAVCQHQQIIQIYLNQNNSWNKTQSIQLANKKEKGGSEICFISEQRFIYHTQKVNQIYIYNKQENTDIFGLQIKFDTFYNGSMKKQTYFNRFIQEQNILLIKLSKIVYLFKISKEGKLETLNQIKFNSCIIYGVISFGCQFFVSWDDKSKEIQVRRLPEDQ